MASPLPQPVVLFSLDEGVAFLGPTGHPIDRDQLRYLLTREARIRGGVAVTTKVRGKTCAPVTVICKVHRDWVLRTRQPDQ